MTAGADLSSTSTTVKSQDGDRRSAAQEEFPKSFPNPLLAGPVGSTAAINLAVAQQQALMLQPGYNVPIQPMASTFASFAPMPFFTAPQAHQLTHNLIPQHLQSSSASVPGTAPLQQHGSPGAPPAVIPNTFLDPALTVQDRPLVLPVFNGVNPQYPGLRMLHASPPVFCVDNFLGPHECDFLIQAAADSFGPAPVVGRGAGEVSPSRTSSTCYLAREDLPDYLRKVSLLTGKPVEHCELPQVGRYLPSQQYLQHFDAFDLSTEDGRRFAANGGQRTVTVLVYLNDCAQGGATAFPALNLEVQPRRGTAIVFFPATVDGMLDKMALHAALPAVDVKYISQIWIRQAEYNGQPSKRLPQTLGVPFHSPSHLAHRGGSMTAPY